MTRRLILCLLLSIFSAPGCSEESGSVVTGTVTVDNMPAKKGYISFFPVDKTLSTSGAKIVDGQYTANVPPGTMNVQIRVPKVVGEARPYGPNGPVKPVEAESLPPKYNDQTELVLEVQPGTNEQDYDLSTK